MPARHYSKGGKTQCRYDIIPRGGDPVPLRHYSKRGGDPIPIQHYSKGGGRPHAGMTVFQEGERRPHAGATLFQEGLGEVKNFNYKINKLL